MMTTADKNKARRAESRAQGRCQKCHRRPARIPGASMCETCHEVNVGYRNGTPKPKAPKKPRPKIDADGDVVERPRRAVFRHTIMHTVEGARVELARHKALRPDPFHNDFQSWADIKAELQTHLEFLEGVERTRPRMTFLSPEIVAAKLAPKPVSPYALPVEPARAQSSFPPWSAQGRLPQPTPTEEPMAQPSKSPKQKRDDAAKTFRDLLKDLEEIPSDRILRDKATTLRSRIRSLEQSYHLNAVELPDLPTLPDPKPSGRPAHKAEQATGGPVASTPITIGEATHEDPLPLASRPIREVLAEESADQPVVMSRPVAEVLDRFVPALPLVNVDGVPAGAVVQAPREVVHVDGLPYSAEDVLCLELSNTQAREGIAQLEAERDEALGHVRAQHMDIEHILFGRETGSSWVFLLAETGERSDLLRKADTERLRFYHADGTFEVLGSAEEVTAARVSCAARIDAQAREITRLGQDLEISNAQLASANDRIRELEAEQALDQPEVVAALLQFPPHCPVHLRVRGLQGAVSEVLADLIKIPGQVDQEVLLQLGNLDALVHQVTLYAATGRIECAS